MNARSTLLRALAALAAAALWLAPAAAAKRDAPKRFYGAVWDGEVTDATFAVQDEQWGRMAANGVETVRVNFNWALAQPQQGQPPNFERTDRYATLAARHGIKLLPIVLSAPEWAQKTAGKDGSPPRNVEDFTAYLRSAVGRYGPNGSFWAEHPELPRSPLREWVLWNEPHFIEYWTDKNWERGYGKLLRAAAKALRKADKGARVALAGLTGASWDFLERLYEKGDVEGSFDIVTIHPYTRNPSGLTAIVRRVREVMSEHGDGGKDLFITEFGWSASKGIKQAPKSIAGIQVTPAGMADNLTTAYDKLISARKDRATRVARAYWYTYSSRYSPALSVFSFSGLERFDENGIAPQPALTAYRDSARRHQGCTKSATGACVAGAR